MGFAHLMHSLSRTHQDPKCFYEALVHEKRQPRLNAFIGLSLSHHADSKIILPPSASSIWQAEIAYCFALAQNRKQHGQLGYLSVYEVCNVQPVLVCTKFTNFRSSSHPESRPIKRQSAFGDQGHDQ